MNFFDIKIESERLLLIPIEMKYAEDKFHQFNKEVTKYMWPKPADNIEETEKGIHKAIKEMGQKTDIQLVILKKETEEFLGCAGLHNVDCKTPEFASGPGKTPTATATAGKP